MDKLKDIASLTRRGYKVEKSQIEPDLLQKIKEDLQIIPNVNTEYVKNPKPISIFFETKTHIYLPPIWALDNIGKANKNCVKGGDKIVVKNKFEPRDYQKPYIEKSLKQLKETGGCFLAVHAGFGKCLGYDTPVMMYDGTIKPVQDIVVGDKIMGDDSKPRNVLSLARGKEQMYRIKPVKGNSYIVNESHILSLKITSTINKKYKKGDIMDISVKDYLKLKYTRAGKGNFVGFKVPVSFPEKPVEMDPYILGLWLGDGTSRESCFTTNNHQIIKYLHEKLPEYNMYLEYKRQYDYMITNIGKGNLFRQFLSRNNLLANKHIPHNYKCNSRQNRLKLLAGLIDTDGYKTKVNMYSITQKNEKLMDDIVSMCLTLGFFAHKREVWKSCTNSKDKTKKKYFQTSISGFGIEDIPVLINRKKCGPRKLVKNPLHSSIKVEKLEVDNYYGFEIDGNRRFLLGDCTVTHNTIVSLMIAKELGRKTLILVHTKVLLKQWEERISSAIEGAKVGIIQGKNFDIEDKDFVIAMLQTIVSKSKGFDYKTFESFGTLLVDESHHIASPTFQKALPKLGLKYKIGLSATPKRADGMENVFYYYLGNPIQHHVKLENIETIVKNVYYYDPDNYEEVRKWNGGYDLHKMNEQVIDNRFRNMFIVKNAYEYAKLGRQIIILSTRRNHLLKMEKMLFKKCHEENITIGLYLGGMKSEELEVSSKCNIILATYQLVSEGTDIPTLNTLIMAAPKKEIEQVVGRIQRAKNNFKPLVLDICDDYSVFANQNRYRNRWYKKGNYIIEKVVIKKDTKNIPVIKEEINKSEKITKFIKIKKKEKKKTKTKDIELSGFCLDI
jgi:superfamily II DNA or RNA helicase